MDKARSTTGKAEAPAPRRKSLLSSWGVPFDGFDVENEPERAARPRRRSASRACPRPSWATAWSMDGIPRPSPSWCGSYASTQQPRPRGAGAADGRGARRDPARHAPDPPEHLGMKKPGRDRSVHQLGFHVFRLSVSFVDTREQGYLSADVFEEMAPAGMVDGEDIARYGDTRPRENRRLRQAGRTGARAPSAPTTVRSRPTTSWSAQRGTPPSICARSTGSSSRWE